MKQKHQVQERFRDARAQRVIGFLAAKKLLITDQFNLWPNTKIRVEDALWVAKHVEPRVLEVLPAALIRFPRTFFGKDKTPRPLKAVVAAIARNEPDHPDYEGISYQAMKRWANRELPDRRTKPLKEQKRNRTFRLKPTVIDTLKCMAKRQKISETEVLEQLILG